MMVIYVVMIVDASGNFARIMDVNVVAPRNNPTRRVIHIKAGVYKEYVAIGTYISNMVLITTPSSPATRAPTVVTKRMIVL
jgi:pectinesterase